MTKFFTFFVINMSLLIVPVSHAMADSYPAAESVTVTDAYVRTVPPGQQNTGVFMTLTNTSTNAASIINATSPAAKIVELHTHINEGGMMKMRRIEKIEIPANGNTLLKPGGLHVMLIGLNRQIVEGEPVDITLEFAGGGRQTVQAKGKKLQLKMHQPKMGSLDQHNEKMRH